MKTRRTTCRGCERRRAVKEMIPTGRKDVYRCAYCVERLRERRAAA